MFVMSSAMPRTHSREGWISPHVLGITSGSQLMLCKEQGLLVCSQVYCHKIASFLSSREEGRKNKGDSCLSCNFYQQQSSQGPPPDPSQCFFHAVGWHFPSWDKGLGDITERDKMRIRKNLLQLREPLTKPNQG